MGIISSIITGLIVGAIAKLLMPGRDPGGWIITILLGIIGATIAGWIGHAVGWYQPDQGPGIVASVLGAMLLLFIYRIALVRRAH